MATPPYGSAGRDTRTGSSPSAQVDALPTACPSCTSASIVSTAKSPSASGYWRCEKCGEIWSPDRRQLTMHRGWRA